MASIALGLRGLGVGGGGVQYADKVLGYAPLAYWPLWEKAGGAAVNYGSIGAAGNGTYVGPTLDNTVGPDGVNGAPFFDGVNDRVNVLTAALTGAWPGDEGSLVVWGKVANLGAWTDGQNRAFFRYFDFGAGDLVHIRKYGAPTIENIRIWSGGGGGSSVKTYASGSPIIWFCVGLSWSVLANVMQPYLNGAAKAAGTAGAWGTATATDAVIGAYSAVTQFWHGWLAHVMVFGSVLTPAEFLDLATI